MSDVKEKNSESLTPKLENIKVGDWVVVRFTINRCYRGTVVKMHDNADFTVKFLRHDREDRYIWPQEDDICDIDFDSIENMLQAPSIGRRGELTFEL